MVGVNKTNFLQNIRQAREKEAAERKDEILRRQAREKEAAERLDEILRSESAALLEDPEAVSFLVDALPNCDSQDFISIAGTLESLGQSAVEPLISLIKRSDIHSFTARCRAGVILGRIRDARAVPALLDMLSEPVTDSGRADVHRVALMALKSIGTPEALFPTLWARDYLDPIESQYAQMSADLVLRHGPLTKVECLSHYPKFEIHFIYADGSCIYSGQRRGVYDINFLSLGYAGEGPRYAEHFLRAAGYDLTYEEIKSIRPGDVIQCRNGRAIILRSH
jgi:hypothetical protein